MVVGVEWEKFGFCCCWVDEDEVLLIVADGTVVGLLWTLVFVEFNNDEDDEARLKTRLR